MGFMQWVSNGEARQLAHDGSKVFSLSVIIREPACTPTQCQSCNCVDCNVQFVLQLPLGLLCHSIFLRSDSQHRLMQANHIMCSHLIKAPYHVKSTNMDHSPDIACLWHSQSAPPRSRCPACSTWCKHIWAIILGMPICTAQSACLSTIAQAQQAAKRGSRDPQPARCRHDGLAGDNAAPFHGHVQEQQHKPPLSHLERTHIPACATMPSQSILLCRQAGSTVRLHAFALCPNNHTDIVEAGACNICQTFSKVAHLAVCALPVG